MKNIIISTLLAGILVMTAGCVVSGGGDEIKTASEVPAASEAPSEPAAEIPVIPLSPTVSVIEQRLGAAVKDAYSGIEIDAFIRERKAILPGFAIPVTVLVKNTGDKTVDYIHGSGSYTTPEALFINADGLQTVLPADHLGPVTADFRTEELKPGDSLEFTMHIMAIEPNSDFNMYTIEMFSGGEGYIAEKGWDELHKKFPDLIPAKSGSYQGQAYFLYYARGDSGAADFTEMPNGYAEYDFPLSIS